MSYQRHHRQAQELRPIHVQRGFNSHAEGSAWLEWGNNRVIATVSVEKNLPPHLRQQKGFKSGWLTAEYSLLPRSTKERVRRERLYASGRTQEIQRLLGRAFRSIVNLDLFVGQTLTIDIDIVQADGGTRCAGIVAGYAALFDLSDKLIKKGKIDEWPLSHELAAVSVGIIDGQTLVDLDYQEDVQAAFDLNIVATAEGALVEVQGGSESDPVPAQRYVQLVATGIKSVQKISEIIRADLSQPKDTSQSKDTNHPKVMSQTLA